MREYQNWLPRKRHLHRPETCITIFQTHIDDGRLDFNIVVGMNRIQRIELSQNGAVVVAPPDLVAPFMLLPAWQNNSAGSFKPQATRPRL